MQNFKIYVINFNKRVNHGFSRLNCLPLSMTDILWYIVVHPAIWYNHVILKEPINEYFQFLSIIKNSGHGALYTF